MRHIARLAAAEKTFESTSEVPHHVLLYQKAREMGTSYHLRIGGKLLRAFEAAVNSQLLERESNHSLGTTARPPARNRQPRLQAGMRGIDAEADDM